MPTLRSKARLASRISATPDQPEVLLDDVSPYGSRRVVVEFDGSVTSAYLHDCAGPAADPEDPRGSGVVAATWLANHVPGPDTVDIGRLRAGQAPLMPAEHTTHPGGRPRLDPHKLRTIWLEEGDGVAIVENGELLAIIPGWANLSKGMPGYSRDVIGQTPFAWSLDPALEGLGPRIAHAERFWRWRADQESWASIQETTFGHLLGKLGPGGGYWDVSSGKRPQVGVSERPPIAQRQYTVLSTVGMSCQAMPVVEQTGDGAASRARIELAIATTMPSTQAARIFLWLAQLPWREMTWLGPWHSIPWYHEAATFPLGGGSDAVLLLDDPSLLLGPEVPRLDGFTFADQPVTWLWLIPINARERRLARERGSASLVTQLAAQRRSWVWDPAAR